MFKIFTEHPASVGESYVGHFWVACGFGLRMVGGGLACLVHAFLPFLFVKTGSHTVADLYDRMVRHRHHHRGNADMGSHNWVQRLF